MKKGKYNTSSLIEEFHECILAFVLGSIFCIAKRGRDSKSEKFYSR
jgi:hypothetical protein